MEPLPFYPPDYSFDCPENYIYEEPQTVGLTWPQGYDFEAEDFKAIFTDNKLTWAEKINLAGEKATEYLEIKARTRDMFLMFEKLDYAIQQWGMGLKLKTMEQEFEFYDAIE